LWVALSFDLSRSKNGGCTKLGGYYYDFCGAIWGIFLGFGELSATEISRQY